MARKTLEQVEADAQARVEAAETRTKELQLLLNAEIAERARLEQIVATIRTVLGMERA